MMPRADAFPLPLPLPLLYAACDIKVVTDLPDGVCTTSQLVHVPCLSCRTPHALQLHPLRCCTSAELAVVCALSLYGGMVGGALALGWHPLHRFTCQLSGMDVDGL